MKLYLFAFLTAFSVSFALCLALIPLLKKLGAGQNVLSYVTEHKNKSGTPTFGGLAFIPAAVLTALLFEREKTRVFFLTLAIGGAYLAVGFLDDFLKKKHRDNLGLTAAQKFGFQAVIAVFSGVFCYKNGLTLLRLPFSSISLDLGWGIIPLAIFVFLATVNGVNLTDGLDGLAAGVSAPFFLFVGLILLVTSSGDGIASVCFSLVGALTAYLLFNAPKASVFMGDTGSLSLGGFAACVCLFSGNALLIPILGVAFVITVLSVILQVVYFKATGGKRIFKMSPIHHHFQKCGFAESKISYAYFTVTLLVGTLCLISVL